MEKIYITVCDDELYYIEEIQKLLCRYEKEQKQVLAVESYLSGEELLTKADIENCDIFLLDVDMPGVKGTELGKEIRKKCPYAVIIFITAFEDYAYEAFQADALGYLVKPVRYEVLLEKLHKSVEMLEFYEQKKQEEKRYLHFKNGHGMIQIDTREIVYIEKSKNKCIFHLDNGEISLYLSLADVYQLLDNMMFYYVHQGYIVNLSKIIEVKGNRVYLKENIDIPVSRKYKSLIRKIHMERIMGM